MKDKILIGIIIILLLALFIETAYLLQLKFDKSYKSHKYQKPLSYTPSNKYRGYNHLKNYKDFDKTDPFQEMEEFSKRMNEFLKDTFIFKNRFFDYDFDNNIFNDRFLNPDTNIEETDKYYIIKLQLPHVEKEKINIEIEGNALIISAESKKENANNGHGTYRSEHSFSSFKKIIPIPEDIKVDEVTTEYKDGLLIVKLPKRAYDEQAVKPRKDLQI